LREHFADHPARRARTRILSAAHGLLRPDDVINTYDRRLTPRHKPRATQQDGVGQLDAEFTAAPNLSRMLIIVEPLYLLALQRAFDHLDGWRSRRSCLTRGPGPTGSPS